MLSLHKVKLVIYHLLYIVLVFSQKKKEEEDWLKISVHFDSFRKRGEMHKFKDKVYLQFGLEKLFFNPLRGK